MCSNKGQNSVKGMAHMSQGFQMGRHGIEIGFLDGIE